MNTKLICWLIGMLCALTLQAQNEYPTANPTMTYVDADGAEQNETQYDGSAPSRLRLKPIPKTWVTIRPCMNGALHVTESRPFPGA